MKQRVNLDAMIPREDFGVHDDQEFTLDLFNSFPISYLEEKSPQLKLLRKPDFQRETNHWSADQIATFIASFLDNEIIPSLILWKSPNYIFILDGGHRLSALRAWMNDDYGDLGISTQFYNGEVSNDQKNIAKKARKIIEARVGRYSTLNSLVGHTGNSQNERRANLLVTRSIQVQWVQGSPLVAESSFYKINSQGTPLDEIEESLIRNRRKPIAIGARSIIRAGTGHKYWSAFKIEDQTRIQELSSELYDLLFEPETDSPTRTLDLSLGGVASPLNALSILIELLTISASQYKTEKGKTKLKTITDYADDEDGSGTKTVLALALKSLKRITGKEPGSLGLHPAVYFYNERGKHSRFMLLGMVSLIAQKSADNDPVFL